MDIDWAGMAGLFANGITPINLPVFPMYTEPWSEKLLRRVFIIRWRSGENTKECNVSNILGIESLSLVTTCCARYWLSSYVTLIPSLPVYDWNFLSPSKNRDLRPDILTWLKCEKQSSIFTIKARNTWSNTTQANSSSTKNQPQTSHKTKISKSSTWSTHSSPS